MHGDPPADKTVTIHSTLSNAWLAFSAIDSESFRVTFRIRDVRVEVRVWGFAEGRALAALFRRMARDWRGWDGARSWRSAEGDVRLACTSNQLGHIMVEATLSGFEKPEQWRLTGTLIVDPGQLDKIANELQGLFWT